ncbi:MAG: MBL fold hydrolase [Desulfuromonas sp.]|uniref:MBL fold metallo-hydrolase RNA specificity domain-containing protein n=1 Tax=Desulfuromonas sp. TaxID=892 RepID=UPI000CADA7A9|nr:MBL fold metallo-hydrolase [Desulfuromonas sp.]PLX85141.1 MAG: MBL fold hydrolase [Desulfuromonas sp.]
MIESPKILHHGGAEGVTGSCHELRLDDDAGILIDCGLFQGGDKSPGGADASRLGVDFPIAHLKALVVTHVHIDHVGRLPQLLASGFEGPIYCSEPSALLLPLVLEDAVKIGFGRKSSLTKEVLERLEKQVVGLPYGQWQRAAEAAGGELDVKLQPAGHIFGSAYVECRLRRRSEGRSAGEHRVVFSGDLGAPYAPLLPSPRSPYRADTVVMESTYGDRMHENRKERRLRLMAVVERALSDRGVVLVPAFSIGRTQELLYELEDLIHRYRQRPASRDLPWGELEVIVDSPLASRFTEVYRQLVPYWDKEARHRKESGRHPLTFTQLTTIGNHREHLATVQRLKKTGHPCIVVAASGMCSGGRIVNYLKALLGDPRTDVLFVGYQAFGTPGRDIQRYGPEGGYVVLDRNRYPIRAGVHTIGGYSAHADHGNLVNFVRRIRHRPSRVILIHGDEEAKAALKARLQAECPGTEVLVGRS